MDVEIDTVQSDTQFAIYQNGQLFKVFDIDRYTDVLETIRFSLNWVDANLYAYEFKLHSMPKPYQFPTWFNRIPRNNLLFKEGTEWV